MRTILLGLRVSDLATSLDFYTRLGYEVVGKVDIGGDVTLAMLKFPDEEFVSLELAHRPAEGPVEPGTGLDHLAVQVDGLAATRA
ncbi:VOC family protein, partial [Actinomadura adrarensis]